MSSLSQGPFNHNRFAAIDEFYAREKMYFMEKAKAKKAKPDFLDMDGDGDEKESMKKAISDKKKGKDMKESKCGDGCDCDDCKARAKKKMNEGSDIQYPSGSKQKFTKDKSDPKVKAGREAAKKMNLKMNENRFAAHGGKDTDAGAKYAKPSKGSKKGVYTMKGKDGKPLFGEEVSLEEMIIDYLMDHGYANNPVSAEVVRKHMSETWLNDVANEIEEGWKPMNTAKVTGQKDKAYDKEQAAARAGNEKEVNKQMQRRIAMGNPSGRKAGLENAKKG